jgi:diguanylate cyclase (GGDEF)-like protein
MATPINVLIAEDSADDTLVLIRELQHGGFEPNYQRVETAEAMRTALQASDWDLVIADHKMPRFSSTEALQEVKNSALDLPVIIVSGNIGEQFAVDAMRAGAHDYIMKDSLKRLAPAIERELREAETRAAHRRAEDTIRHMAYHDALTDLVNRHEFEARLDKALASALARDTSHALLYLDLDQFKIINDTSGHVAGDEMLKQLAVVLAGLVRDNDTLARLGGDEFGILLESCPLDRAREIAENLRRAVEQFRFAWQGRVFSISVSIGVAAISKRSRSTKDVMSAADMTCYAAKDQGRNRVEVFVQNDTELTRRQGEMEWVSRINQALVDDRLVVYQQRIVPLNGADGFGSEMLLRMYDEDEKLVLPGAFIPAAERYNLMPAIDRRVIDLVLAKLAQDQSSGVCFINLSGASLSDHSFFTYIRDTLVKYAISPPRICFEITETAAIANLPAAIEFIRGIKEEGCRFALDDFGSGLSSFSYLKSIPVDFLKIDGAFVRNILVDRVDCAIVEAITCIAQEADIETIAESVEEDAVKQRLQALGVCYAQGYCIEYPHAL